MWKHKLFFFTFIFAHFSIVDLAELFIRGYNCLPDDDRPYECQFFFGSDHTLEPLGVGIWWLTFCLLFKSSYRA